MILDRITGRNSASFNFGGTFPRREDGLLVPSQERSTCRDIEALRARKG